MTPAPLLATPRTPALLRPPAVVTPRTPLAPAESVPLELELVMPTTPAPRPVAALCRPCMPLPSGLSHWPETPRVIPLAAVDRPSIPAAEFVAEEFSPLRMLEALLPMMARGLGNLALDNVPEARLEALRLVRPAPEPPKMLAGLETLTGLEYVPASTPEGGG